MTSVQAPTVEDLAVQEARKLVLRALDAKICVQDDLTALKTVELASGLSLVQGWRLQSVCSKASGEAPGRTFCWRSRFC